MESRIKELNLDGNWMETFTGKSFYPLNPRKEDVDIVDISHALSNLCRYGGHCQFFYSVAQHSINVYKYLLTQTNDPIVLLDGLLHDASEAYLIDMPRPIKQFMENYKVYEGVLQKVIYSVMGLPENISKEVHYADNILLSHEAVVLMHCKNWNKNPIILKDIAIEERKNSEVKQEFLDIYYKLKNEIENSI